MKKRNQSMGQFTGVGTALVTPFEKDGRVSKTALGILVDQQIAGGVNFLVPCGTTGESPALTHDEHDGVIEFVVKRVAKRIPVWPGTGSNTTHEAVALTMAAKQAGADGALVVSPYYVKPTQSGIKDYYRQVASVGLQTILYDIPGRCGGQGVTAETILELAEEGTIVGLKWASGNLDQLQTVLTGRPNGFKVFSGDDNLTYLAMCLGADGVISVLSNLLPKVMAEFIGAMYRGDHKFGLKEHYRLLPLMRAMFFETNPLPVKTALALVHDDVFQENFRSPMVTMEPANKERLAEVLRSYGLLAIAE